MSASAVLGVFLALGAVLALLTPGVAVAAPPVAEFTFDPPAPLVGQTVTFTSMATDPDLDIVAQNWDLDGNGAFDNGAGATVEATFAADGPKTVGLEVIDATNERVVVVKTVTVSSPPPPNQPPIASFMLAPATAGVGETVTFASTSRDPDGVIQSHAWDLDADGNFDDGTQSTARRSFRSPGAHLVQLEVTDNGGDSAVAKAFVTVVANRPPIAAFSYEPTQPVAGQPIVFSSRSSDPDGSLAGLEWDLDGDGQFDDAAGGIVQAAYPAAGSYTVSLRATDDKGRSSVAFQSVAVLGSASRAQDAPAGPTPGISAPNAHPPAISAPSPGTSGARYALLSPFPIVRIRGHFVGRAVQIEILSVRAPRGAVVRARCRGVGCPRALTAVRARSARRAVRLRRLERRLSAGTVIEIFVAKRGWIGKYTKFKIRSGAAPVRRDLCLRPGLKRPVRCPGQ